MRLLVFALAPALVFAAANPERLAKIAPRMRSFVDSGKAAGAVTLLRHRGASVHHEAVGYLSLDPKTPLQRDSIFQIMSMTKPVTCLGIMMLAEDGLLGLADPVEKHLPEFRGQTVAAGNQRVKPARPITIRDLMTHTSGLAEMPPEGMGGVQFYYRMNRTLAEAVTMFSQMPLLFQPGARWQYSNPGLATLGRIIEAVSGSPYDTFLDRRVFAPLGMKDTFFYPDAPRASRISTVYQDLDGKLAAPPGFDILRNGAKYPMPEGGLYSTAADMAAFYQALLSGGKPLISRASLDTMTAIHTADVQQGGTAYGLGWAVVQKPAGMLAMQTAGAYGHGGAFGTYGWIDSKRDLTGVLMIQLLGAAAGDIRQAFVEMANAAIE